MTSRATVSRESAENERRLRSNLADDASQSGMLPVGIANEPSVELVLDHVIHVYAGHLLTYQLEASIKLELARKHCRSRRWWLLHLLERFSRIATFLSCPVFRLPFSPCETCFGGVSLEADGPPRTTGCGCLMDRTGSSPPESVFTSHATTLP
jgi:hypothetical protein